MAIAIACTAVSVEFTLFAIVGWSTPPTLSVVSIVVMKSRKVGAWWEWMVAVIED
jgi:hypothetical protein